MCTTAPSLLPVATEQHDVVDGRQHQETKPDELDHLGGEMTDNGKRPSPEAERQRPPVLVMSHGCLQDEEIRDERDGDDATVKAFIAEKAHPHPRKESAKDAQARGANRALEHRQGERPELNSLARTIATLSHGHGLYHRTGTRPRPGSDPGF